LVFFELWSGRNPFEENGGEGGKGEYEGMGATLSGLVGGVLAALVADVRTAVVGGVGVEDFFVVAGVGDAEAVTAADDGSSVDDGDDEVFRFFASADEGKNAVVGVVGVNPFESLPFEFDLMESGLGGVKMIEVSDEFLDAAMGIVLKEVPIEAAGFAPFVALGEFLPHEEEFFAGMGVLISVKQAEIGELLPNVAGHFVEERIFSVDDFVVGKGKKKIFSEGVEEREGEFVVFVFAMDGIVRKEF
jgi:hypothetical protein